MSRKGDFRSGCSHTRVVKGAGVLVVAVALLPCLTGSAQPAPQAASYSVIAEFGSTLGAVPYAGLIADSAGNIYGTTVTGGAYGYGTVYELPTTGGETVLYNFTGGGDGAQPVASLLVDSKGNLYGTAELGGVFNDTCPSGCGVVFEVSHKGRERVLYAFTGGSDGYEPASNLIHDSAGNLFGTTPFGGLTSSCVGDGLVGCGVVFEVSRSGQETVLYTFTGGADGAGPSYGLFRDLSGNLYGTTSSGGDLSSCVVGYGCGVVFKLDAGGNETVLYTFTGGSDGGNPNSRLIQDAAGNLYGTTLIGGDLSCGVGYGCGVVFKLDSAGSETVLHTFTGPDGEDPVGGVVRNASTGALYGLAGGGGAYGFGCIFRVSIAGKESILHSFDDTDGANPIDVGGLLVHGGQLYGTTPYGGADYEGVAFKISP